MQSFFLTPEDLEFSSSAAVRFNVHYKVANCVFSVVFRWAGGTERVFRPNLLNTAVWVGWKQEHEPVWTQQFSNKRTPQIPLDTAVLHVFFPRFLWNVVWGLFKSGGVQEFLPAQFFLFFPLPSEFWYLSLSFFNDCCLFSTKAAPEPVPCQCLVWNQFFCFRERWIGPQPGKVVAEWDHFFAGQKEETFYVGD